MLRIADTAWLVEGNTVDILTPAIGETVDSVDTNAWTLKSVETWSRSSPGKTGSFVIVAVTGRLEAITRKMIAAANVTGDSIKKKQMIEGGIENDALIEVETGPVLDVLSATSQPTSNPSPTATCW